MEPLRWWDAAQTGDIIHFFGRMPADQINLAHQKGLKIVMADLLGGPGSRSEFQLRVQKILTRAARHVLPHSYLAAFKWDSYRLADACIALTGWEAHLMQYLFDAPRERIHLVPNGVEEVYLNAPETQRGQWLVSIGTITAVKRVLELAEAAVRAQTPIWIIGRAYTDAEPYAQKFFTLARRHPQYIRYEGAIEDRARLAQIYREARGFVLLSRWESLSLSALEAAACGCPLLLSDLPWAHATFGDAVKFCPVTNSLETTAKILREFYDTAPGLPAPKRPMTWLQVARQFKLIYERIL